MKVLALELSTPQGSLAVLADGDCLAEIAWREQSGRTTALFQHLPDVLGRAGVRPEEFDLFVAGRGPGSYSGLRVSLTAAQALALPGAKPVYAVSSGEALALELTEADSAPWIAVVGDARRGTLWLGVFQRLESGAVRLSNPWKTLRPEELPGCLPEHALVVSPDFRKLQPVLESVKLGRVRWLAEDRAPRARYCALAALRRLAEDQASEPPIQLYLHPAVDPAKFPRGPAQPAVPS
jgi:tRNA threonylcarbamoyladenosine biosynthesis protein TsaB